MGTWCWMLGFLLALGAGVRGYQGADTKGSLSPRYWVLVVRVLWILGASTEDYQCTALDAAPNAEVWH